MGHRRHAGLWDGYFFSVNSRQWRWGSRGWRPPLFSAWVLFFYANRVAIYNIPCMTASRRDLRARNVIDHGPIRTRERHINPNRHPLSNLRRSENPPPPNPGVCLQIPLAYATVSSLVRADSPSVASTRDKHRREMVATDIAVQSQSRSRSLGRGVQMILLLAPPVPSAT